MRNCLWIKPLVFDNTKVASMRCVCQRTETGKSWTVISRYSKQEDSHWKDIFTLCIWLCACVLHVEVCRYMVHMCYLCILSSEAQGQQVILYCFSTLFTEEGRMPQSNPEFTQVSGLPFFRLCLLWWELHAELASKEVLGIWTLVPTHEHLSYTPAPEAYFKLQNQKSICAHLQRIRPQFSLTMGYFCS